MPAVAFPTDADRLPRPQAPSALYAALAANTERFNQPYQYAIPPLQTSNLARRLSSAAYDSASSGLPSPTWPTPPHTPALQADPKPLLLPPPIAASPIRMSPRAHPRRLSNASARFSRRVSIASALSLSRPPSSARLQSRQVSVRLATASARNSGVFSTSALPDELLGEGDVVGDGVMLNGEQVVAIDHGQDPVSGGPQMGARARYEIVKKLGSGSYATVFLAREILSEPAPPTDSDLPFDWSGSDDAHADPDATIRTPGPALAANTRTYGRPFAIKCLSRASLTTPESLAVQMLEATIHGRLPVHPNVVSLHAALESRSCLFLVLEYVRGPDLFYFLEQSRDALPPSPLAEEYEHEFTPRADSHVPEPTPSGHHTHTRTHSAHTPPTPSLLSALGRSFILSPTRLRLIASMFSQMCGAVAACHVHGVSHRDIKPENFIVTDAWVQSAGSDAGGQRKVVVKLSDFGLATDELESSDMDCGSAPYMSYECRNNCAPTYNPRAADVWSLGIVLINMLYHVNPWADTFDGACPSFTAFRADPIAFFTSRFAGMTQGVAHFLATRVFCIPDAGRIDAAGFGEWVRNLADHFDVGSGVMLDADVSVPVTPVLRGLHVQREGLIDVDGAREVLAEAATMGLGLTGVEEDGEGELVAGEEEEGEVLRTTTSGARKRGKRGARKNKATASTGEPTLVVPPVLGEDPAAKIQDLARELSKQSAPARSTSSSSVGTPTVEARPALVKKPSKWSLFRVRNESGSGAGRAGSGPESVKDVVADPGSTATVRSLLGSLEPPAPLPRVPAAVLSAAPVLAMSAVPRTVPAYAHPHAPSPLGPADARGRSKPADRWGASPIGQFGTDTRNKSPASLRNPAPATTPAPVAVPARLHEAVPSRLRESSPARIHEPARVYERASAAESANWRQSTSTVSSTFTQFSNASVRTVSTVATSVSGASMAVGAGKPEPSSAASSVRSAAPPKRRAPPPRTGSNVKYIEGTPWELDALPRQAHPRVKGQLVQGDIFGRPTPRNKPPRGPAALGTISEQPPPSVYRRSDASGSSAALERQRSASPEVPKKVQKGQINTLNRMLRAFGSRD